MLAGAARESASEAVIARLKGRKIRRRGAALSIWGCGEIFAFRLPAFTIMSVRGGGRLHAAPEDGGQGKGKGCSCYLT